MKLIHPFRNKCPDVDSLLKNEDGEVISSIEAFCHHIEDQSHEHWAKFGINEDQGSSKYKGDALELFTEFMIKTSGSDNRIRIWDYQPVTENDTGVDGSGVVQTA
jgi:hypothetical protein